jgi:hypothetical protein
VHEAVKIREHDQQGVKNKHQAVSQGAWRFGERSILADM